MPGLFGFFALAEEDEFFIDETPIHLLQGESTEVQISTNDPIETYSSNSKIAYANVDSNEKLIEVYASKDNDYYGDCVISVSQNEKCFEIPVHVDKVYIDAEIAKRYDLKSNEILDIPYNSNAYILRWQTHVITQGTNAQQKTFMRGLGMIDENGTKKFRMVCFDPDGISEGQIEEVTLTAYVQGTPITSVSFRCYISVPSVIPDIDEITEIIVAPKQNVGLSINTISDNIGFVYNPQLRQDGEVSKLFFTGMKIDDISNVESETNYNIDVKEYKSHTFVPAQTVRLNIGTEMPENYGFVYVPDGSDMNDNKAIIRFVGTSFDEIANTNSESDDFQFKVNMSEIKE